jgi:hypothetical protein
VGVTSGALAEVLPRREVHDARDCVFEVPERGDQIVEVLLGGIFQGGKKDEVIYHGKLL